MVLEYQTPGTPPGSFEIATEEWASYKKLDSTNERIRYLNYLCERGIRGSEARSRWFQNVNRVNYRYPE